MGTASALRRAKEDNSRIRRNLGDDLACAAP
jgi:hypothetical protein